MGRPILVAGFSQRQGEYAHRFKLDSSYTPQMVIDGHAELVGNDESGSPPPVDFGGARAQSPRKSSFPGTKTINCRWRLMAPANGSGQVLLAITEDGLSTQVGKGENGGRTLRHSGVVRELREIGSLRQGQFSTAVKTRASRGLEVRESSRRSLRAKAWPRRHHRSRIGRLSTLDYGRAAFPLIPIPPPSATL